MTPKPPDRLRCRPDSSEVPSGKTSLERVVVVQRETDLLEVVRALGATGSLAGRLHRRKQVGAMSTAMMAITTSNSISVKPRRDDEFTVNLLEARFEMSGLTTPKRDLRKWHDSRG